MLGKSLYISRKKLDYEGKLERVEKSLLLVKLSMLTRHLQFYLRSFLCVCVCKTKALLSLGLIVLSTFACFSPLNNVLNSSVLSI